MGSVPVGPAPAKLRLLAFAIDASLVAAIAVAVGLTVDWWLAAVVALAGFPLLAALLLAAFGTTLGKRAVGIHVVADDGARPPLRAVLRRELWGRLVLEHGLLLAGGAGAVGYGAGLRGGPPWHDVVSGTRVVRPGRRRRAARWRRSSRRTRGSARAGSSSAGTAARRRLPARRRPRDHGLGGVLPPDRGPHGPGADARRPERQVLGRVRRRGAHRAAPAGRRVSRRSRSTCTRPRSASTRPASRSGAATAAASGSARAAGGRSAHASVILDGIGAVHRRSAAAARPCCSRSGTASRSRSTTRWRARSSSAPARAAGRGLTATGPQRRH